MLEEIKVSALDRKTGQPRVFSGDFNAATEVWGATSTNRQGRALLERMARNYMVTVNTGDAPHMPAKRAGITHGLN